MSENPINFPVMKRRTFIAGAVITPFAAKAALALPVPAQTNAPVTLTTFSGSNMMQRWRWDFGLLPQPDGTFTLTGLQTPDDEDDDLWEIDPVSCLRSGEEICHALLSACEQASGQIQCAAETEGAALQIERIDPALAAEFRRAVTEYFGEEEDW